MRADHCTRGKFGDAIDREVRLSRQGEVRLLRYRCKEAGPRVLARRNIVTDPGDPSGSESGCDRVGRALLQKWFDGIGRT